MKQIAAVLYYYNRKLKIKKIFFKFLLFNNGKRKKAYDSIDSKQYCAKNNS